MKKIIFPLVTILIFAVLNFEIYKKETTLNEGKTVLLKLAPRDPRSLMQGDFMRLRYDLPTKINKHDIDKAEIKGQIVVKLDINNIATFVRFYQGEALNIDEHLLNYKRRRNMIQIGAESYFFQEGQAKYYQNAQYGELKVDESGKSVLFGLRDKDYNPLGPPEEKENL